MLAIGKKAPAFTLLDQNGKLHKLSDSDGKWRVVYFYPKDDTAGCTKEACAIAEVYKDFTKVGVKVFGISKDSPASHKAFAKKYNLPFTLLSDESTKTIEKYGAWQERSMYGRKFMGTIRMSYVINPEGKVSALYPKVSPDKHALQLLADLKTLKLAFKK